MLKIDTHIRWEQLILFVKDISGFNPNDEDATHWRYLASKKIFCEEGNQGKICGIIFRLNSYSMSLNVPLRDLHCQCYFHVFFLQMRVNFSFLHIVMCSEYIFFSCYRRTYDTLSYRCLVPCVRTEFCDGKFELLDICNENPFQMLWERSLVILKFYRRWCRCLLVLKKFQFFAGMLLFFFSFTKSTFFKLCRPSVT